MLSQVYNISNKKLLLQQSIASTSSRLCNSNSQYGLSNRLQYSINRHYRVRHNTHTINNYNNFYNKQYNNNIHKQCLSTNTTTTTQTNTATTTKPSIDDIANNTLNTLSIDSIHSNFKVISHTSVPELNMTLVKLQHIHSNTLWYHSIRSDDNNTFVIGFKTPVNDSTGVAHILEHTVLCGSQLYNVRDPFFTLLRRSLNTYMNALTASDHTMYPVASTNTQDLYNLMSVYCDAVFNPLLRKEAFLQEGHRLVYNSNNNDNDNIQHNHDNNEDIAGHIQHGHSKHLSRHGVVYNEMKGVMSDNNSLYAYNLYYSLFNDTNSIYIHNSGGDPKHITDLKHEELLKFHQQHYNIYNAVFMSYGHEKPHFELIDKQVIQPVIHKQQNQNNSNKLAHHIQTIDEIKRWSKPREYITTCPPDTLVTDPKKQSKLSLAWLIQSFDTDNVTDIEWEACIESFGLSILVSLLIDGPNTPLYQSLLERQDNNTEALGSSYAPNTGYDSSINQPIISFGLANIDVNNKQIIIDRIMNILTEYSTTKQFEQQYIDALLHQFELNLKQVKTNFGIDLCLKLINSWAYNHNIDYNLQINKLINDIKQRIKDGYLQKLIKKHLLDNQHRLTYIMNIDDKYLANQHIQEQKSLIELENKLTVDDINNINNDNKLLTLWQQQKDDLGSLPGLNISDIKQNIEYIKFIDSNNNNNKNKPLLQYCIQPTNTLVYINCMIDIHTLPNHLLQYINLYTTLVNDMSTEQLNYKQLSHNIELYTGGVNNSNLFISNINDLTSYKHKLLFNTYCLKYNITQTIDLLIQIIYKPVFNDINRLIQLLYTITNNTMQSLQENAHTYSSIDVISTLWPTLKSNNLLTGIPYVQFLHQLITTLQTNQQDTIDNIIDKLQQINQYTINQGIERILVHCDNNTYNNVHNDIDNFVNNLQCNSNNNNNNNNLITTSNWQSITNQLHYYSLPLQVNYVSMSIPTVSYIHQDAAKLDIMCKLVSQLYIHSAVREKGGAYGGWCSHNSNDGYMIFSSYRDPNQYNTVQAYIQASEWLMNNNQQNYNQSNLDEAKLSTFQSIDSPKPPQSKGLAYWLYSITDQQRQLYRQQLLNVTLDDIRYVAQKYLIDNINNNNYNISILGKQDNIDTQITNNKQWKLQQLKLDE